MKKIYRKFNIAIGETDKTEKSYIISPIELHESKIEEHLDGQGFIKLGKDPSLDNNQLLDSWVNDLRKIGEIQCDEANFIESSEKKPGKVKLLYKTHKEGFCYEYCHTRLITKVCGSLYENLSRWVEFH